MHRIFLTDEFWTGLNKVDPNLRRNIKGLDALRRYRVTVPLSWPLGESSFSQSLFLYYKSVCVAGQLHLARTLYSIFLRISNILRSRKIGYEYQDDYIRALLKFVSSYAFDKTYNEGPGWMFLVHLHALGGKAPYEKTEIEEDIDDWVREKDDLCSFDPAFRKKYLDGLFARWNISYSSELNLPFGEYANDVFRWGTSGGAPKTELYGTEYRTKWAWGFKRVLRMDGTYYPECNLYTESLKETQLCNVALKEEPTKTRPVITTPMSSYLRQSYLMYRAGKPPLESPISSGTFIGRFQSVNYPWYGCIDGEKFDHSISAEFIMEIIDRLGNIDSECRQVADAELRSMKSLKIKWGDRVWAWKGGLLSGWRITSVIGSIVSDMVGNFIIEKTGMSGAVQVGVMGDDLVLYSYNVKIPSAEMVYWYEKFGLHANLKKTTSGSKGEFLRKVYCKEGVFGYPALGLKSVMFASPWVEKYTYEFDEELANGWLTFYSRLLPHALPANRRALDVFMKRHCVNDLSKHSRVINKQDFDAWLSTPQSAGGGGCFEWNDFSKWCTIERERGNLARKESFLAVMGVLKVSKAIVKHALIRKLDVHNIVMQADKAIKSDISIPPIVLPRNVNLTRALVTWYMDNSASYKINVLLPTTLEDELRFTLPYSLRVADKSTVLKFILGMTGEKAGLTIISTTKESTSIISGLTQYVTSSYKIFKKLKNLRNMGAAATIVSMRWYKQTECIRGTW